MEGNVISLPSAGVKAKAGEVIATEDQAFALTRIAEIKDLIDSLEAERKSLTCAMLEGWGEAKTYRWQGGKATRVSVDGRETFDLTAYVAAHPERFEETRGFLKKSEPFSYIRLGR